MNKGWKSALSKAIALVILGVSGGAVAADDAPLNRLAWLSGCWRAEGAERGSGEQWLPLAGGSLIGVSRTVREGKTVGYEFMRIAQGQDGKLAFFAHPSGQEPGTFPALSISGSEVIFEDLKHDFPQRIIYRLEAPDRLRASIEGMRNGSLKSIVFPLLRVSCDAQLTHASVK